MYGLRDASRIWYQNLIQYLLLPELGFTQSPNEPCLLFRSNMIIIVYVDDMGVATNEETLIDELITFLQSHGLQPWYYIVITWILLPDGGYC